MLHSLSSIFNFSREMWKEKLPKNCPPVDTEREEITVYRFLRSNTLQPSDFIPYAKLYSNNIRYQKLCKAYAISFYDSKDNALKAKAEALGRGKDLGNYVATFHFKPDYGAYQLCQVNGHISAWFSKKWDLEDFIPISIQKIDEN